MAEILSRKEGEAVLVQGFIERGPDGDLYVTIPGRRITWHDSAGIYYALDVIAGPTPEVEGAEAGPVPKG